LFRKISTLTISSLQTNFSSPPIFLLSQLSAVRDELGISSSTIYSLNVKQSNIALRSHVLFPRAKPDLRPFESQILSKNTQSKMILTHSCAHTHPKEPQVPLCSWPSPVIGTSWE